MFTSSEYSHISLRTLRTRSSGDFGFGTPDSQAKIQNRLIKNQAGGASSQQSTSQNSRRGQKANEIQIDGNEGLGKYRSWLGHGYCQLTRFPPSGSVFSLDPASDLAPPWSPVLSETSPRPSSPIPYWSKTPDLADAGDSKAKSVPVPVLGNAITSRRDGVLHRIDINLSNPIYEIVLVCVFLHTKTRALA